MNTSAESSQSSNLSSSQTLTPADLRAFIEQQQIEAALIDDIGDTPTVPAAAAALGVKTEQIIKTLLFLVERTNEPGKPVQPVVVISNGQSWVDKRPLADHFGVGKKRVKLAPAEVVLNTLGYPAGGVPPFGHHTQLPVILDAAVIEAAARAEGIIYGGGGDDRTMMKLTVWELKRVVEPVEMPVSA